MLDYERVFYIIVLNACSEQVYNKRQRGDLLVATDDTQYRIVEAAGPIFASKGYRDATVREICEAAGVGLASVNYHFRDKQQLYVRVVEHAYEELHSHGMVRLDDVPEMPPMERLTEWISRVCRKILREGRDSWQDQILSRELRNPTPVCEVFLRNRIMMDLKPLLEVLEEVLPAGTSDMARWRFAHSVMGQALFYDTYHKFTQVLAGDDVDMTNFGDDKVAEHIARFCGAALGLTPPLATPATE